MSKEDPVCAYLLLAIMAILLLAVMLTTIWAASIGCILGIVEGSCIMSVIVYMSIRYIIDNNIFE